MEFIRSISFSSHPPIRTTDQVIHRLDEEDPRRFVCISLLSIIIFVSLSQLGSPEALSIFFVGQFGSISGTRLLNQGKAIAVFQVNPIPLWSVEGSNNNTVRVSDIINVYQT